MALKVLFHVLLELKILKILSVFLKQAKNKYYGQGELNLIKLLLKTKVTLIYFGNVRIINFKVLNLILDFLANK